MINETNDSLSHFGLINRIVGILGRRGFQAVTELRLPNRKIADVAFIGGNGAVHIIEAKIDFRPVHLTEARYHYGDWCDLLWIAVPANQELPASVNVPGFKWSSPDDTIGVFRVDREAMGPVRSAHARHPHPAARSKTLNLLRTRLTDEEPVPAILPGPAAERPKNSNAGHEGRRCQG